MNQWWVLNLVFVLFLCNFAAVGGRAQGKEKSIDTRLNSIVTVTPGEVLRLKMIKGTSAVLVTRRPIDRFALGDPQIVAVTVLAERELVVNAKSEGITNIVLWEEAAQPTNLWVEVSTALKEEQKPLPPQPKKATPEEVEALLKRALSGLAIEPIVLQLPDETIAVILRGEAEAPEEIKAVESFAQMLTPKVINMLRVRPTPSPPQLTPEEKKALLIEQAVGIPGVKVTIAEDKVILQGQVRSLAEKLLAEERAKPFGTVINRLEVIKPTVRQFVAEVQVLEVSRNALQKLGISWGTTQVTGTGGTAGGVQTKIFTVTPGQAVFGEETVEQPIGRVSPIGAQISALIQSGQARLLANPQQKTIEGSDATFLVGGLIPIPVFGFFGVGAGAAAPGAATVVFFPFGITLTLHPEATSEGEIFLQMRVEVTAPDYGLATQVLGTTVPGFRFRGLDDVKLLLRSGDTVVISGLIQDELREQISRFPLLSKIPILGELFKSREFVRQQTELVITVTIHMEETPVTEEALRLMQTYQKRPVLPRPSFGLPTGTFPSVGGFGASPIGTSIGSATQTTSTQQ
ncbi:pilus assembly protein N-terminal domain-containing protein [Fervidibacter sacchari]|uniref:Flp pilus assembly secretin CpaC n=1 Tax=Candidatus Fervidibacter sacchari TaxID=1448929 RepID=A0ABT2ERL5_9BACT|nr:pilus assembly protein N-terminal domain-containing protein [Candidatus Fervidibacter sacchari]MCS3920602.1 Flp pilus assembly secretin CpaC [Candidatus Fervidibacter sacchari]WKU17905.1 pilus assembly protein N-terminal domain-containing protein [Candidatus Fervidibacter sacchari]